MKRSEWRAKLRWGTTISSAVLFTIWVVSAWMFLVVYCPPSIILTVVNGRIEVMWAEPFPVRTVSNADIEFGVTSGGFDWEFERTWRRLMAVPRLGRTVSFRGIWIPGWVFVITMALPAALLWYRELRYTPGRCHNCRYNLHGNQTGICPECGAHVNEPYL